MNTARRAGRTITSAKSESARPRRKKVEDRGPLHVENPDPAFKYFWPLDASPSGQNCFRYLQNGWEFVTKDDKLLIGDSCIFDAGGSLGSIYRVPAVRPENMYHFFMKLPKEWADEDDAEAQAKITAREQALFTADKKDGQYGHTGYE